MHDPLSPKQTDEFVRTLTRCEPRVYAYIRSLVANWADAEEVLQETNAALWRKAAEALAADDFLAWACGVARFEVLRFRKRQQKQQAVRLLSDEFLDAVTAASLEARPRFDLRRDALDECLKKLPGKDRELIQIRYSIGGHSQHPEQTAESTRQLAEMVGRPVEGMYKAMARIRRALFECIERRLTAEDRP